MLEYIVIEWEGHISLNQWYASKHWSYRKKQKDHWHELFKTKLNEYDKTLFKKYKFKLYYNSRLDPSNTITMVKLLEDTMKKEGWIIDDSSKYCAEIRLKFDPELPKKSYRAVIEQL